MLDDWAKFVPVSITPPTVAGALTVFTGTGISVPEAMIAFLLLLVKTIGREMTRKRFVEWSARTIAVSEFPVLMKRVVPPVAAAASWVKLINLPGSIMAEPVCPVLFATPAAPPLPVGFRRVNRWK